VFLNFLSTGGGGWYANLPKNARQNIVVFWMTTRGIANPSFSVKSGQKIGVELLLMTKEET
jgi:hypothetical protein